MTCEIDDCDQRHCTRCHSCMPFHRGQPTLCQSCECDIEAEDDMRRHDSPPDDPAYDDETPEHVQKRMAELEKLARELYTAAGPYGVQSGKITFWHPSRLSPELDRRACELLGLDPPPSP
jgi:hypothetical protein